MVDAQTCEMGATLAPLNYDFQMIHLNRASKKYAAFVSTQFGECKIII
jgi:hypothetical protein